MTIERPEQMVIDFFHDPANLSTVLGDVADVEVTGPGRYRWRFRQSPFDGTNWECVLVDDDSRMRFVDACEQGDGNELTLNFNAAPQDRGTEVTLRVKSPAPRWFRRLGIQGALPRTCVAAGGGNSHTATEFERACVGEMNLGIGKEAMRALCWNGVNDLSVETVDDPTILNPHDVIVRVRLTTTCGSDLHFIDGYLPGMREGDVFGHEFMGEVVEVGNDVTTTQVGARVVVPSFIACNHCNYCERGLYSLCDTTNPNAELLQPILGYPCGGVYGYTHPFGGYAGSHAEYIRVPFGGANCFAIPDYVSDQQALFMSDAVPTGYMGADFCDIKAGDTVAVWGAGGVGLMAARGALLSGAERVIVIDRIPERLTLANKLGAETIDYTAVDSVQEALRESTGGRGPDGCIDAVGMKGHGTGIQQLYDRAKQLLRLETDRASALWQAIHACGKGGTVAVLGIYGLTDKFPMGIVTNKGLTLKSAQQHGHRYIAQFFDFVQQGDLDPAVLITMTCHWKRAFAPMTCSRTRKMGASAWRCARESLRQSRRQNPEALFSEGRSALPATASPSKSTNDRDGSS